jgi:broad specificity polyphosphatase/5'/3'-nucleotidase SurE
MRCRECDETDLPAEQAERDGNDIPTFRDAWEDTGTVVQVNMPKARVIHMDRIRVVRNAELVKESGSKYRQPEEIEVLFTPRHKAKLQELRDIPQTLNLDVDTPEELKAIWPKELPLPIQ